MEKQDLIKQCSYYKGETVCPDKIQSDDKEHIWFDEKRWVTMMLNNDPLLSTLLDTYKQKGYTDFEVEDDVPISLKAYMLDRFYKLDESIPIYDENLRFVKWYKFRYRR